MEGEVFLQRPRFMNKAVGAIRWAEVAAWVALIFMLSGESFTAARTLIALQYWVAVFHLPISQASLGSIHMVIRKTAHLGEFFVLGILLYRALSGGTARFFPRTACWVLGAGLFCALADELHQFFARSRTPSVRDSVMDFAGVITSQLWILFRSATSATVVTYKNAGAEGPVEPSPTGALPRRRRRQGRLLR